MLSSVFFALVDQTKTSPLHIAELFHCTTYNLQRPLFPDVTMYFVQKQMEH